MSRLTRPLSVALLGLLLLAWGPCPGLWAQTLGATPGPERGSEQPTCCCGCGQTEDAPAGEPVDDSPLDEDCSFCGVFGGRGAALTVLTIVAPEPLELLAVVTAQPDLTDAMASFVREGPDDHAGPPPLGGPLGPVVLLL